MSLIFDKRAELAGTAGVHALIVGVSEYEHAHMNLDSGARSAEAIVSWLLTHDLAAPLCTCRALFSPADAQLFGSLATVDNFLHAASAWREDAATNEENITVFYFCGHGMRRSPSEDLMLFSDFGSSIGRALRGAVPVENVFQGMAPSERSSKMARTQLFFIDTSRSVETTGRLEYSAPTLIFDEYITGPDDRSAVIFYATSPGKAAYARFGEISLFADALLRCLDGEAATSLEGYSTQWGITVNSLIKGLSTVMERTAYDRALGQAPVVGGLVRDHPIRFLPSAPMTNLTIKLVNAQPEARITVKDHVGQVVTSLAVTGGSAELELASGLYVVDASAADGSGAVSMIFSVAPPSSEVRMVLPI